MSTRSDIRQAFIASGIAAVNMRDPSEVLLTGDGVRQLRTEVLGMTQKELAEIMDVRQCTISAWECTADELKATVSYAMWAVVKMVSPALDLK